MPESATRGGLVGFRLGRLDDHLGHGEGASGGDDEPEHDEHGGDGENEHCGTEALVAGAKVLEAELKLTDGGAVWTDVELLKP